MTLEERSSIGHAGKSGLGAKDLTEINARNCVGEMARRVRLATMRTETQLLVFRHPDSPVCAAVHGYATQWECLTLPLLLNGS
jgi:hypothetical protein